MLNWILFTLTSVLAYVFISLFGQLGGDSASSAFNAALSTFKPLPFVILIVGNVLWGVAVYFGFRNTNDAIPAAIAIGVITSFVYSVLFLHDSVTWAHVLGLVAVLVGVYLLR